MLQKKIKKNFIFDTNNVSKKKEPLLIIIYTNNIWAPNQHISEGSEGPIFHNFTVFTVFFLGQPTCETPMKKP